MSDTRQCPTPVDRPTLVRSISEFALAVFVEDGSPTPDRQPVPITHPDLHGCRSARRLPCARRPPTAEATHWNVGWAMWTSRSDAAAIRLVTRPFPPRLRVKLSEGIGLMPQRLRRRLPRLWLVPLCVAVAALVGAVGAVAPTSAMRDHVSSVRRPGERHPEQAPAVHPDRTISGTTCRSSRRSPTPIRARTGIRRATPASRATRRRRTTSRKLMKDAGYDVTIQTYKFTYFAYTGDPGVAARSRRPRTTSCSATTGIPGRAPGRATADAPAGRRHRHPADADAQLGERLHRGRLQRLRAGPDRADPARHLQLRREGPERPGRGRIRRDHLQRGQPRPHRRCSSGSLVDAAGNPIIPTIPVAFTSFDIGHDLYNAVPAGGQGGTALPVMNLEHPRRSSTRTPTTTTSSPSRRAATRTTSWSSTRTWTRSTARECSTTLPAPRRSWTSRR